MILRQQKRMYDSIFGGCIPIVLSEDFVWPFTNEFDGNGNIGNNNSNNGDRFRLDPSEFSLRINSQDFYEKATLNNKTTCEWITNKTHESSSLQSYIESITVEQLLKLRKGVERASKLYSYYEEDVSLPANPLREKYTTNRRCSTCISTCIVRTC